MNKIKLKEKVRVLALCLAVVMLIVAMPLYATGVADYSSAQDCAKKLGATIGHELINESFDFAVARTNTPITITGANNSGWEFGEVSSGAIWSAGRESAFSIGKNYGLNLFSYVDDGAVLLPAFNTSNYIFTAKIKNGGNAGVNANIGILTDIDGSIKDGTATTSRRFSITYNSKDKPYAVSGVFTRLSTNSANNVQATLQKNYTLEDFVTVSVVSYQGTNYYFINDDYITSQPKSEIENERVGFFACVGDAYIDDVVVNALIVSAEGVTEDEYAKGLGAIIGEEVINESFDFTVGRTNTPTEITGANNSGWEFGEVSSGALWSEGKESAFSIGNSYGLNLFSYNDDGAVLLPEINTSNYIFTAKIKNGGNAGVNANIGILTDVDGSIKDGMATTSRRFSITYNSKEKPYTVSGMFTRVGTNSGNNVAVTLEKNYTLEDFLTVSVVSFEGTNYYFINGEYVASQPKGEMANERIGFFASIGDAYIDDVVVKTLKARDIYDQINEAIDANDLELFKKLLKNKKSGITYELIKVDEAFMSVLKKIKDEKGENINKEDIYSLSIDKVDNIGDRLELFVDDTLIDKTNTTAAFSVMQPEFEETILNLSGGFVCNDIQGGNYTGAFDYSRISEDTRPWESLGSVFGNVITVNGKYYFYYRGVDDEVVGVDSYTGQGETLPLSYYLNVCLAVSDDGINWTRPELDLFEFEYQGEKLLNNIVIGDIAVNFEGRKLCSFSPFFDKSDTEKPFKAVMVLTKEISWWGSDIVVLESSDGIHWDEMNNGERVLTSNRDDNLDSMNVAIWCEAAQEYRLYFRDWRHDAEYGGQRVVAVVTSKDLINWSDLEGATYLDYYSDLTNEELITRNKGYDGNHPDEYQLYTNAIHTYDRAPHIYIGLPTRYLGTLGYEVAPYFIASHDGVNFKFWDTMLIEPSAELGRDGNRSNYALGDIFRTSETEYSFLATRDFKNSGCIIDRFSFRVDGFVAAVGDSEGKQVVTTPITFSGNSLVLNFKAPNGTVRAQLTDTDGNVIEGFSFDDCTALTGDYIEQELVWKGDLSTINQPVKVWFELVDAELFSYKFAEKVTEEFIAGDVDGNGVVDAADLAVLKKVIAKLTPMDDPMVVNTDVDGNGQETPDAADLAKLKKIIAKLD